MCFVCGWLTSHPGWGLNEMVTPVILVKVGNSYSMNNTNLFVFAAECCNYKRDLSFETIC